MEKYFNKCFIEACLRLYNDDGEIDALIENTHSWAERRRIKKDREYLKTLNDYRIEHKDQDMPYIPIMYFFKSAEIMKEIVCYMSKILNYPSKTDVDLDSDDRR